MNLELHKEFSLTFEKHFQKYKQFTVYWCMQNFFEYLQDKGVIEIKTGRNYIRLIYKTSVSNLYLRILFEKSGEMINLMMGYTEADLEVCVWEFHRGYLSGKFEEGFHNWFEDPENAYRFPSKRTKPKKITAKT